MRTYINLQNYHNLDSIVSEVQHELDPLLIGYADMMNALGTDAEEALLKAQEVIGNVIFKDLSENDFELEVEFNYDYIQLISITEKLDELTFDYKEPKAYENENPKNFKVYEAIIIDWHKNLEGYEIAEMELEAKQSEEESKAENKY